MISSKVLNADQLERWSKKLRKKMQFHGVPDFIGCAMVAKSKKKIKDVYIDDDEVTMVFCSKSWFATEVFTLARFGFTKIKVNQVSMSWYPFSLYDGYVLIVLVEDPEVIEVLRKCLL